MTEKYKTANLILSAIVTILGIAVLIGWYTHSVALIQVHPSFVPMQYNTALGFLLSGVGLLMIQRRYAGATVIVGFGLVLIGGLTLIEYIARLDLGIDQLFMEHYVTTKTSHPGRMAPNTALCFLLTGLVLSGVSIRKLRLRVTLLGPVIMGLGLIALFGYLSGIETAYGWGQLTRMAVHTSLGFVMIGVVVTLTGLSGTHHASDNRHLHSVISTAIAMLVIVISLWQALSSSESRYIRDQMRLELNNFNESFVLFLESEVLALERMAKRWEQTAGGTPHHNWEQDARNYIQDFGVFQLIEWISPSFEKRWSVSLPDKNREKIVLIVEKDQQAAMQRARDNNIEVLIPASDENRGVFGITIYVPIYQENKFLGLIHGIIRINSKLSLLELLPQFNSTLSDYPRPAI